MSIHLNLSSGNWAADCDDGECTLRIRGTIIGDLAGLYSSSDVAQITSILDALNGFYAIVLEEHGRLVAAVDHIRSLPLFYARIEGHLFLGDDAEWVRQKVGDQELDPVAAQEFQLAGYVTGSETLFPNVKQLQAGECLIATDDGARVRLATNRYYRFLHTEPEDFSEARLWENLDNVAVASIQRLIDYANGRQIVVPLSGGYDSRLVVMLLKRLGYDNILAFSYGVRGNKESLYSKRIADALGLEWHFVEYSKELWRKLWPSEERWQYQKWASGWSSLSHVQDWPAVKALKQRDVLEPDCVFAPGHTGDFVSGGHIPPKALGGVPVSHQDLADAVLEKHYCLAPLELVTTQPRSFWAQKIRALSEYASIETGKDLANASEKWEWQERQAKFICNSVRVYEYFNYDWWLPLWDKKFVEFWASVPIVLRAERAWYIRYVDATSLRGGNAGATPITGNAAEAGLLRLVARRTLVRVKAWDWFFAFVKKLIYSPQHPLASYGRYRDEQDRFFYEIHERLTDAKYSLVGLNAYDFIAALPKELVAANDRGLFNTGDESP